MDPKAMVMMQRSEPVVIRVFENRKHCSYLSETYAIIHVAKTPRMTDKADSAIACRLETMRWIHWVMNMSLGDGLERIVASVTLVWASNADAAAMASTTSSFPPTFSTAFNDLRTALTFNGTVATIVAKSTKTCFLSMVWFEREDACSNKPCVDCQ